LTRSAAFGATSLTGNPTFDVAGSGNTLYLGSLFDNSIVRTITVQDSGIVYLTAAATNLSQGTIVNVSGNLVVGASNALGSAARVNLTGSGTFGLSPTSTVSQTISSLSGGATTTVNLGSGALTISSPNLSSTFAGNLTDVSGGALVQAGAEPLILTGNGSGLVSGTQIFVNASTLESDSVNALGSFAQISVAQGATLALGANNQQFSGLNGAGTVTMFGQSFTVGNTDNASSMFSGILASGAGGSLTKDGTGTFTITGANTHTAGTIVNAGTLAAGPFPSTNSSTPLSSGLVTLSGGTLALQGQTSTAITNPGLLLQFYNATYQNGDLGTGSANDLTLMNSHFSNIQSSLVSSSLSTAGATYLQFPGAGVNGATQSTGNGNSNGGNAFTAQGFNQTTNYEVLLSGNITIDHPGTYTFYTASDDGSVLFFNNVGTPLVNNNFSQVVTQRSGTINIASAGTYPIEVGYYQAGGGAGLTISYSGPDTVAAGFGAGVIENIPNSVLSNVGLGFASSQPYANNVLVTANSGVSVSGSLVATMGDLTINGSILSVTSSDTSGNPYSLTFKGNSGITTLTGSATFNVFNSASGGTGTLFLGALNDGGTHQTIGFGGGSAVTLNQAATSLVAGTQINVNGGTLNSNVGGTATTPGSLGSFAQLNLGGGTFSLGSGASQTISTLSGSGAVNLGNNTLTIGNTDNISPLSPFGGAIGDGGSGSPGSIVKAGGGTLYLTGASTYHGGTTVLGGTLALGNSTALGSGVVTLSGGKLQFEGLQSGDSPIGIHFGTDQSSGAYALAPTSVAGVPGFAISNWNNAAGGSGSTLNVSSGGNSGVLVNSLGAATGSTVSWSSANGTFANSNTTTPDNQLMGSFLNDGQGGNTVTFTNIPFASYEVITYVGSEGGGANGRESTLNVGSAPTYYFSTDTSPGSNPYAYVQITNITNGSYPGGNYAITTGLTGSTLTVTDGAIPNNSNTGLEAVEIIGTTAPVTTVALANSITVTQSSTMDLTGTTTDSAGPLSIGSSTLSITGGSTGANVPFTLTLGATTLSGSATINVANNGSGIGSLVLGAVGDGGPTKPGAINKTGLGTLVLASPGTYTGGTTVNAGTLFVANTSGSATGTNFVSVKSGATLAGSTSPSQGFITGAVTINSGGAISGSNGNTLTLSGGLTLASGSTNSAFNLTGSASANPLIATSGGAGGNSFVANGANAVTVTGTPSVGIYDLFGFAGAAPSVGSFALAAAPAGMSYMINVTSSQVDLEAGSIDESGSGTFNGTVLSSSVANGGSYAGLASTTSSMDSDSPNPGIEGTTATILTGTNHQGSALTLRMTWRSRTLSETPANDGINGNGFVNGNPTSPPLAGLPLISDVVNLFGMAAGSTGTNVAPVQTDPFVFQMSFNPATLKAEGATNADMATRGNLYLASLIPVNGVMTWENTIDANFAVAGATTAVADGATVDLGDAVTLNDATTPFIGTFAQWESDNPLFNSTDIANYLGVWGVDPDTLGAGEYNAWAIVNHNSDFAVVPEPSSLMLAGIGVAGLLIVARKRRATASNMNSTPATPRQSAASAA
jgi:autotransporter-associated beta strand protein